MRQSVLKVKMTESTPEAFLREHGGIFARLDRSMVSGTVAYGVEGPAGRYFIKSAGDPDVAGSMPHALRVELLLNGACVAGEASSAAVPRALNVVQTPHGPLVVYEWFDGVSLGVDAEQRTDPASAFVRFKRLPLLERCRALTSVFAAHVTLAGCGWVAGDFYDGTIMYDFEDRRVALVDLDMYRRGPFQNQQGRMFGSPRFMAPEEHTLGAQIDERTTVFNMGRCLTVFLADQTEERSAAALALKRLETRACSSNPEGRFQTMREYFDEWTSVCDVVVTAAG